MVEHRAEADRSSGHVQRDDQRPRRGETRGRCATWLPGPSTPRSTRASAPPPPRRPECERRERVVARHVVEHRDGDAPAAGRARRRQGARRERLAQPTSPATISATQSEARCRTEAHQRRRHSGHVDATASPRPRQEAGRRAAPASRSSRTEEHPPMQPEPTAVAMSSADERDHRLRRRGRAVPHAAGGRSVRTRRSPRARDRGLRCTPSVSACALRPSRTSVNR